MSALLEFYLLHGLDHRGRTFDDIMAFTDEELEATHDYIQWIFPLPEPSRVTGTLVVATADDLRSIQDSEVGRRRSIQAVCVFGGFLDRHNDWRRANDHNLHRITRMLRFMALVGNVDGAERTRKRLQDSMDWATRDAPYDGAAFVYWHLAVNPRAWDASPYLTRGGRRA